LHFTIAPHDEFLLLQVVMMRRNPRRSVGAYNHDDKTGDVLPACTQRKRKAPVKKTTIPQTDLDLDASGNSSPTLAEIDSETHHLFPEEARVTTKSRKRTSPSQGTDDRADRFNTGAFAVLGPASDELPAKRRRYATDSSHLDRFVNKERERRSEAFRKFDQLTRHGLVRGESDHFKPILAVPDVDPKEDKRRRKAAQKLIDQYVYESSGDEVPVDSSPRRSRAKPRKNRLVALKQALTKLEQPPGYVEVDSHAACVSPVDIGRHVQQSADGSDEDGVQPDQPQPKRVRSKGFAVQQAYFNVLAVREEDSRSTRKFQRAMKDPQHPDFGISFLNAVDLAMAEEKKTRQLVAQEELWGSDDPESEASTIILPTAKRQAVGKLKRAGVAPVPKSEPQTLHSSHNDTSTEPKFTQTEYNLARASGFDFHDTVLVKMFNKVMQQDDPSRPIRSQASLLEVCRMGPTEYFGENVAIES
jgi:hypothetical protein